MLQRWSISSYLDGMRSLASLSAFYKLRTYTGSLPVDQTSPFRDARFSLCGRWRTRRRSTAKPESSWGRSPPKETQPQVVSLLVTHNQHLVQSALLSVKRHLHASVQIQHLMATFSHTQQERTESVPRKDKSWRHLHDKKCTCCLMLCVKWTVS